MSFLMCYNILRKIKRGIIMKTELETKTIYVSNDGKRKSYS